jgi:endo-1,4-beta-xylanase
MGEELGVTRRSVVLGAAATGLLGAATAGGLLGAATAAAGVTAKAGARTPLWRTAMRNGLLYGSSTATWQISDAPYARLFRREAAILFTEDDLLWYRLKPTPTSELDFTYGDQIIEFAEANGQLVLGAHLVWDEGFGDGWQDSDLWDIDEKAARKLLFGTTRAVVSRYRGRVPIWSCVNEAIVNGPDVGVGGLRDDVPWMQTIGPEYVARSFHVAHEADPDACLLMNDFGYETINQYGDRPEDKRRKTLHVLDKLLDAGVPVHAFGIQAHLLADQFAHLFHAKAYRRFLKELADRGLKILITEMDVLDDGLPAAVKPRDHMVADIYRRYLDVALDEPAVASLITFGLSDRYTWLQEDYPRDDGADRRPLPFDQDLLPKPAFHALQHELKHAAVRPPVWQPPRMS